MTTASETLYVSASIEILGRPFHFDGNQKVTAGNGSYAEPVANSFSLPQIQACPFRTPTCEAGCYVHNLEAAEPGLHALYSQNYQSTLELLAMAPDILAGAFARWMNENARGGFRWHVSGDVFSEEYARFIGRVADLTPEVPQWIYTRSFPWVHAFTGRDNLVVNLSADKDNYWLARRYARNLALRVCYMTTGEPLPDLLEDGDVVFPDYSLRGVGQAPHAFRKGSAWWNGLTGREKRLVCPVDVYGKSDKVRCGPCRKCLDK